jgi:hypothetical protein
MKEPAPLFTDAFQLSTWLLQRLDADPRTLPRAICQRALRLLAMITLALKDRDRLASLGDADESLIVLRVQLRLAGATGLFTEDQLLFALGYADRIGRQLGGWQRSLDAS